MARRQKQKNKLEKDSNASKMKVTEMFKKHTEIAKIIAGLLIALYPITNYIYQFRHQVKCENFYGIPGKYFSTSINSRLLYFVLIVLLIIIFLLPSYLRKYEKKQGKDARLSFLYYIFLSIVLGLVMGLVNLQNLIEIIQVTYSKNIILTHVYRWIDNHAYIVSFAIIIMGSLSLFGIVVVPEIKRTWFKEVVAWISIISFTISGSLIIFGTLIKLGTSIEYKTEYEIITNQEKKYVVLSEEDNKVLVVEYFIVDEKYKFDTNQYCFLDKYDCSFRYVDIKVKPGIINERFNTN